MLYTEMITTGALVHGDRNHILKFDSCEHPIALQLGGSNPSDMAKCAEYATEYNYDEVNINVGCPSDRVQAGRFGACLILEPTVVADCIRAIATATEIDVTVKTRIGVDDQDSYKNLLNFVEIIAAAGCATIIVHARKAYLSGLSPKQNRTIPPLRYDYVYRLKQDFPQLNVILNGGLNDMAEIQKHLNHLDGVMVGRKAYENPYFLVDIDAKVFNESSKTVSRHDVLEQYKTYVHLQLEKGVPLKVLTRHIHGLFNGLPGAKTWRRHLSEHAYKKDAGLEIINHAAALVANMHEAALTG